MKCEWLFYFVGDTKVGSSKWLLNTDMESTYNRTVCYKTLLRFYRVYFVQCDK